VGHTGQKLNEGEKQFKHFFTFLKKMYSSLCVFFKLLAKAPRHST
jgi:hypothetical protein